MAKGVYADRCRGLLLCVMQRFLDKRKRPSGVFDFLVVRRILTEPHAERARKKWFSLTKAPLPHIEHPKIIKSGSKKRVVRTEVLLAEFYAHDEKPLGFASLAAFGIGGRYQLGPAHLITAIIDPSRNRIHQFSEHSKSVCSRAHERNDRPPRGLQRKSEKAQPGNLRRKGCRFRLEGPPASEGFAAGDEPHSCGN
jgi:hypothetical protein